MKQGNFKLGQLEQRAQDLILDQLRTPEGYAALNRALQEAGLVARAMAQIDLLGHHMEGSDSVASLDILQDALRWAGGQPEIRFGVDVVVNGIFPIDLHAKLSFGFCSNGIRFRMPAEHRQYSVDDLLAEDQVRKMQAIALRSIMTGERAGEIKLHNGLVEVPLPRLRTVKFRVD